MRCANVSHFTTACFDHIFRHIESIWTTHENLLTSNLIFIKKERENTRRYESAETQDRTDVRSRSFRNFRGEHVEAERFAIASVFTSRPDRYFVKNLQYLLLLIKPSIALLIISYQFEI